MRPSLASTRMDRRSVEVARPTIIVRTMVPKTMGSLFVNVPVICAIQPGESLSPWHLFFFFFSFSIDSEKKTSTSSKKRQAELCHRRSTKAGCDMNSIQSVDTYSQPVGRIAKNHFESGEREVRRMMKRFFGKTD